MTDKYEAVIGLEVHIQLLTKSKAYCADSTEFGAMPNTQVSPISLGHPGTLPKSNKKVIEFAVRLGLACHCDIREENQYARKNYFYADLPKGYQITQDKTPICTGGYVMIKQDDGSEKKINLTRIHMEEDAGKSIHDLDPFDTLVDYNRAGVPLLEMVSEPEIRSAEEAYKYLSEIRKLVRYLDICDGNMEEGSMRCDANVSVRLKGSEKFGKRTEVKNMNSIRNVQRAIEFEVKRQIEAVENGEEIAQDTRSFDAITGTTFVMRSKETSNDYRYFPEPDLQPVLITEDYIANVKKTLPPLPDELQNRFKTEYQLSEYDANILTDDKEFALQYDKLSKKTPHYKVLANFMIGPVKSYLNDNAIGIRNFPIEDNNLIELVGLTANNELSFSGTSQTVFHEMINNPKKKPTDIIKEKNLTKESDETLLLNYVKQAISKYPEKVIEYKNGKESLVGLFMGEVMKLSKGKADPKIASELVKKMLSEN